MPASREKAAKLLCMFGLQRVGRSRNSTNSRGMRQRLAIARSLINDPRLLFLDEPTTEYLPHIFDRFYRVDRARSRGLVGAGLGLAIARELTRTHGGEIAVHSVPGEGSTFTVHLPTE